MYQPLETILKTKITQPHSAYQLIAKQQKKIIPNFVETPHKFYNDEGGYLLYVTDHSIEERAKQIILSNNDSTTVIHSKIVEFDIDPEHWVLFYADNRNHYHRKLCELIIKEQPFIFSKLEYPSDNQTSIRRTNRNRHIKYSEKFFDPITMTFGKKKEICYEVY